MLQWSLFFFVVAFAAGLAGFSSPVRGNASLNKVVMILYCALFLAGLVLALLGGALAA